MRDKSGEKGLAEDFLNHASVLQTHLMESTTYTVRVVNILHVRPAKQFNSNAMSTRLEVFSAASRIFGGCPQLALQQLVFEGWHKDVDNPELA